MLRLVARLYVVALLIGAIRSTARGLGGSAAVRAVVRLSCVVQLVPVAVVLALRWVNPPTTAFMRRTRAGLRTAHADGDQQRAGGDAAEIEFTWVPESRLSPELQLAAIAGEDVYFALHAGFDWESLRSARAENREAGGRRRGGSTISQQVAKNLFLWPNRSYLRKGIEAVLTALIEATWPKRRILEVYLNIAQFGPSTFGAEAASQRFLHKPAAALTRNEAALLVAALPNPHERRVDQPDRSMRYRQLLIVGSMNKLGAGYLDRLGAQVTGTRR